MTNPTPLPPPLPAHLTSRGGDPQLLAAELKSFLIDSITNQPRSQQRRIGPSEIGHPCDRRLVYKLLGAPDFNTTGPVAYKAWVGTQCHTGLESVLDNYNLAFDQQHGHAGQERFLIETRVYVGHIGDQAITGSADVYDRVTATVVDWKFPGPSILKGYKRNGPSPEYRAQAHMYGRGFALAGLPVDQVMIAFLPRQGELDEAYFWHEPYDEQVAIDALARANALWAAGQALGPAALAQIGTADAYCSRCPFFKAGSTDLTQGCPGDPGSTPRNATPPALTLGGAR